MTLTKNLNLPAQGHRQTTDGVGYETEYAYNLSGAMVEQRYPSGRVVKNVIDNNGDLSIVQSARCMDAAAGTDADCTAQAGLWNYAKNFTYNPAGAVTSMQLGNGRWESTVFNSRLQPTQIALGATPHATNILKLDYSYGTTANNGNVLSQTITVPSVTIGGTTHNGFTAVQNYAYDALNRLDDAAEYIDGSPTPSWRQDFTFDRYGNRSFVEGNTTFEGFEKLCASGTELCAELRKIMNPSANASDNRLSSSDGYVFDPAGNTVRDPQSRRFTYDGENKQVKVETLDANGNPVATVGEYEYDGDGKRVKKHVPSTGEVTVFVYDAGGKLIGEYSTVAAPQSPKVSYTTADHLGSPRILMDENGATISRRDFMPFGEEIARTAYGSDTVRQKFTNYERDGETDLDFAKARIYSGIIGRFTSPDPFMASARNAVAQSWNRFVYSLNNPLRFVDPSGLYECRGSDDDCANFRAQLADAKKELERIAEIYGKDSDEYTKSARALNSYGCEKGEGCASNGVIVTFGNVDGDNNVILNDDKTITVTFNSSDVAESFGIVGHEGVHVANAQSAIAGGKTSSFDDEFDGHFVHAVLDESWGRRNSKDGRTMWFNGPTRETSVIFWSSFWDQSPNNVRKERKAAIEAYLRENPNYGLTPTNANGKAVAYEYNEPKTPPARRPARRRSN